MVKVSSVQGVRIPAPGMLLYRVRMPPGAAPIDGVQHHDQGDSTTITFILDGELPIEIPEGIRTLRAGDSLVCPPRAILRPRTDLMRRPVEHLQVTLAPARFQNGSVQERMDQAPEFFKCNHRRLVERLGSGFGGKDPMTSGDMEQILIDWWAQEPRLKRFVGSVAAMQFFVRQRPLIERIHNGDLAQLSVQELAAGSGRDRFHFSRKFVREWGFSPRTYLQLVRLSKALERLVLDKSCSVYLPAKAGFPDVSRFFQQFRIVVGMPPQQFLRESGF